MGGGANKAGPLVSVLMPVYNGERFLEQALRSAQRQSYRNLEILVRDDGSSDSSRAIVESLAAHDRRFVLLEPGERLGGTGNMIELLRLASGEFIKYLHQDDLLEQRCVERLLRPMRLDGALVMATSSRRLIDAGGTPIATSLAAYKPLRLRDAKLDGLSVMSEMMGTLQNQLGEPSIALFRNGVISPDAAFVLDGRLYSYMNDMALWTNLLSAGDLFWHAAPLSSFRTHDGQRSAQLHESITVAGELADYALYGFANGLIVEADVIKHARHLHGYLASIHQAVSALPVEEQAAHVESMAAAVAGLRRMLQARPSPALAASPR
jgi:glycosyltransferase involved in cell wall biosynthesis